ncbi:MAG: hypothetical protein ACPL5F_13985 [Moorellaceae bacterium]
MKVRIGEALFERSFLEDQARLLEYLRRAAANPADLEAHLALGVIHEYHGRLARAISYYWDAYRLDPTDTFIQKRLRALLTHLQQLIADKVC